MTSVASNGSSYSMFNVQFSCDGHSDPERPAFQGRRSAMTVYRTKVQATAEFMLVMAIITATMTNPMAAPIDNMATGSMSASTLF